MRKIVNLDFGDKSFLIIIFAVLIIALLLILSIFIIDIISKRKSRIRITKSRVQKISKKIIQKIIPDQSKYSYRKTYLMLKEIGTKLTVEQFYILKLIVPIVLFFILIPIINNNYKYKNDYIIRNTNVRKANFLVEKENEKSIKEKEEENLRYFEIIKSNMNIAEVKKQNSVGKITEILVKNAGLDIDHAQEVAKSMESKIRKLKNKNNFYITLVLLMFFSFQIVDIFIKMIHKYKSLNRENEKLFIIDMTIGLSRIKDIKTLEILNKLTEVTSIYKYLFIECLEEYESGEKNCFKKMKEKTDDQDIIEIANYLEQSEIESLNRLVEEFEMEQIYKNSSLQMLDNINMSEMLSRVQLLIGTSLFVVVLCVLIPMLSISEMLVF